MAKNFSYLVCFLFFVLAGCGKIHTSHHAAPGINQAPQICIIEHSKTRESFLHAMESWLDRERISHKRLVSTASVDTCPWVLTYYGRWSWDLAIFLADAKITAWQQGKLAGTVSLKVGQWDTYKFEDGEVRVHKLMDMLFAKTNEYVLPVKRTTGS